MDFTREPIIETVITPRDGHRIVVRSSKNPGQEEFFVDALEVVTFGQSCFFRSRERPRAFIVPSSDYEVLEVREPRLPLKTPSIDGIVKIGGSQQNKADIARNHSIPAQPQPQQHSQRDKGDERRDSRSDNSTRDAVYDRRETVGSYDRKEALANSQAPSLKETMNSSLNENQNAASHALKEEPQPQDGEARASSSYADRRRDRRRNLRRRRGSGRAEMKQEELSGNDSEPIPSDEMDNNSVEFSEAVPERENPESPYQSNDDRQGAPAPSLSHREKGQRRSEKVSASNDESINGGSPSTLITSILPPPTTLIRDDLARLRNNELYKGAFYMRDQEAQGSSQAAAHHADTQEENSQDDDDFLITSSLSFDDDDDDINSNAYKATPVNGRTSMGSRRKEPEVHTPAPPPAHVKSVQSQHDEVTPHLFESVRKEDRNEKETQPHIESSIELNNAQENDKEHS